MLKRLLNSVRSTRTRVSLVAVSVMATALALVAPGAALAVEGEGGGTSGKEIAESFVTPLTTKFTEALPVIVGFLVLVAATVAIIKFVQSRGKSKTV
jgi:hypothetical protein